MSVRGITQTGAVVVKSTQEAKKVPTPAAPKNIAIPSTDLTDKQVAKLTTNPPANPQPKTEEATVTPAKPQIPQIEKQFLKMLQDTTKSMFDKIKSLIPIPPSITPILDLFLAKKS